MRGGGHFGTFAMALLHAHFAQVLQQQFFEKVFLQNVPRTGPSNRGIYLTSRFLWFAPRAKFVVHFVCPEGQVRGLLMFADFKVS